MPPVAMALLKIWLSVLIVAALGLVLRLFCRHKRLPPPPLAWALLAAVVWGLLATLPLGGLPLPQRLWISLADDLLLAFAAIRLLLWLGLEVPGGLGWWRKPPELLVQLLTLGDQPWRLW